MPANLSGANFKITGIVSPWPYINYTFSMWFSHGLSNTISELIDYLTAS